MPHRSTRPLQSLSSLRRWLALGNLLVALIVSSAAWVSLDNARRGDEDAARQTAQNLAASLSSEVGAELRLLDNALTTIAERYGRARDDEAREAVLTEMLSAQRELLDQVWALRVADEHGRLVQGVERGAPTDVSGRDDFVQASATRETILSEPFFSKVSGRWVISVARSLHRIDGRFAGVMIASVSSEHFADLFGAMELGQSGAIAMRTSQRLRLVARHSVFEPRSTKGLGETTVSDALRQSLAADEERGAYITRTALDQVERFTAYHRVRGYPLIVFAGLSTSEYLVPWRHQAAELWCLVAVLILAIMAISVHLYRRQVRERAARLAADSMAFRDALTGLPNRRLFEEQLASAQAASLRGNTAVSVAYLDLDGFKPVNDLHGHDAGDRVLQEVARRLQDAVRGGDVVARLGGDEFALVLPASGTVAAARAVLQRCLSEIERPIELDDGQVVHISASIGVVIAQGAQPTSELTRNADAAMYAAKRAGKGRIRFHGPHPAFLNEPVQSADAMVESLAA
jgi:diguanylate cyclase (GGDEF)-like protein